LSPPSMSSPHLISCCCCVSGPHPALHSFPTRRSSDLSATAPAPTPSPAVRRSTSRPSTGARSTWVRSVSTCCGRRWPDERTRPRSEEHTSELQSRENLVCRLLLEKKKITHHVDITTKV